MKNLKTGLSTSHSQNKNWIDQNIKVNELYLDHENPRFPPTANQRETILAMIKEQQDKIVKLASSVYENGLNPSVKFIVFKERGVYIDGDGNRRLTAIRLLETPSLANSFPRIKKKIDAILKKQGNVPTSVDCVVFENRENARLWIAINHNGLQDGQGQALWTSEQGDRFTGKYSIGLQAMDYLMDKNLITENDKSNIKKTTLDRVLSFQKIKSKLSISKNENHFVFADEDNLKKVVLGLRGTSVDDVYTAKKGESFVNKIIAPLVIDNSPINQHPTQKVDIKTNDMPSPRSRRINSRGIPIFGGSLSLNPGHVNNLYRDIESVYDYYSINKNDNTKISDDFIAIIRMALRLLAETAAGDDNKLDNYLRDNFEKAKTKLNQDVKTFLSSQSVNKDKIVEHFHTGAHKYISSTNENQAIALSIILGEMLKITHGKQS